MALTHKRTWSLLLLMVSSLVTVAAHGQDVCPSVNPVDTMTIQLAAVGGPATFNLKNPMTHPTDVKIEWLTERQLLDPNATADPQTTPLQFMLGYCQPSVDDPSKPRTLYLTPADYQDLADKLQNAQAIVIRFTPNEAGKVTRYLHLTWKEGDTAKEAKYRVDATGGVPDFSKDARYKLWGYTGYTYLRSKSDFKDGFAEFLMRTEIRWIDGRVAMKRYHPEEYENAVKTGKICNANDTPPCRQATFGIARIYGEMGLTGTAVAVTTPDPNVPGQTTTSIGGTEQAFGGSLGFGLGKTRLVSTLHDNDTSAFALLGVARLGLISIPSVKDSNGNTTDGRGAFNYSVNVRVENEPSFTDGMKGGNFEGAYFELGFGESEQFSRKKFPRLRFDGLLPINSGSDIFRFAGRLQIDAPRPLASRKKDDPDNLANEVRVSLLVNIDLLELGKRLSGGK